MIKPTPEEVKTYAMSIGYDLDGEKFCDYNQMKGWMVGKTPMKDWRAAVRTWKRKEEDSLKASTTVTRVPIVQPSRRFAPPPPEDLLTWEDIQAAKEKK
jgi:hypothetical protein